MTKFLKKSKYSRLKSVDDWRDIQPILKKAYISQGVYNCELKLSGCTDKWTWAFAHSKKRRFIKKPIFKTPELQKQYEKDILEVIGACSNCHDKIEKLGNNLFNEGKPTMAEIVKTIIRRRLINIQVPEEIYKILRRGTYESDET